MSLPTLSQKRGATTQRGKPFPQTPSATREGSAGLVQASRKINGPPPVLAGLITGQGSTELENKGLRLFGERPDYKESRDKIINIEIKQLVYVTGP